MNDNAHQLPFPLFPQVTDLHCHFIDHLTIPSRQGKGQLRRIEDVFDCWFESGALALPVLESVRACSTAGLSRVRLRCLCCKVCGCVPLLV